MSSVGKLLAVFVNLFSGMVSGHRGPGLTADPASAEA